MLLLLLPQNLFSHFWQNENIEIVVCQKTHLQNNNNNIFAVIFRMCGSGFRFKNRKACVIVL